MFNSNVPSLSAINSHFGIEVTRSILVVQVAEMLDFFNVENSMNQHQIAFTVDLIIEEYPYLQVDDFKLFFKKVMKGEYGKVFNRIDGQVIMLWLKEYIKERIEIADNESYKEHKKNVSGKNESDIFYDEYIKRMEERAEAGDQLAKDRLELSRSMSKRISNL